MDDVRHSAPQHAVQKKRVVIVDDSQSIRAVLRHVITTDPRLEVVGEAADAFEARDVIKTTNPDVVTLDIEMPGMNGLEFLRRLMELRPTPVVMVSSLTHRGSTAAIQALSLGAVDCFQKPIQAHDPTTFKPITQRVYSAACSQVKTRAQLTASTTAQPLREKYRGNQIVLIGASTGGVNALESVLDGLDPDGPPVVIVQHMPGPYLVSFSRMLNSRFPQDVGLLNNHEPLTSGLVRVVPKDGEQGKINYNGSRWTGAFEPGAESDLHCPSVDSLFQSAVPWANQVTAAILTGLGNDGARGLKVLRDAGAHTIGQDSESAVVYGMPRVAFEIGAVSEQLPVVKIGEAISAAVARKTPALRA